MKKLLFSLLVTAGFSSVAFAQTITWDFNDTTAFPSTTAGMTATTTINGLTFTPAGGTNFGIFNSQSASFSDGYSPTQRMQTGGHSYSSSSYDPSTGSNGPMPTQRYISFPVSGNVTIKVWSRGGGTGRSVIVTDGTTVLGKTDHTGSDATANAVILSASYTGGAGTIYIANAFNQNSIFKIEASGAGTLGINDINIKTKANAFSSGNNVFVSGLENKNTLVNVYSATGQLVKSLKTSTDTNFEISGKGVYIVNLKSEAGEKSVKVLIK